MTKWHILSSIFSVFISFQGNLWYLWRTKSSSKRRIKISILSRKYRSDFLELEILRFLLSQKTRFKYFFLSSGVINFLRFFSTVEQSSVIIPTGHTFECQCTARLRGLDTVIVRIFSSSELVKLGIIPLKVRLAGALKGEAK